MSVPEESYGFEEIDRDECLELLASEEVGRLGVVRDEQPVIFPVNYILDGETVVLRTDPGTKLESAPFRRVAFEIDHIDRRRHEGWSVLVQGVAQEITTALDPVSEGLRALPLEPWDHGPKRHWVRIVPRHITGRRITARPRREG